jgi:hypothetical protein
VSHATAEVLVRWMRGSARHSKYAAFRRTAKHRLKRIRRREERVHCAGHGDEPRPRHTGGWSD